MSHQSSAQLHAETVTIPLSKGLFALIDVADIDVVAQHRWYVTKSRGLCYARRDRGKRSLRPRYEYMHTLITGFERTDHVNGDGLDNRRSNLRSATRSQNAANIVKQISCTSRFKGVYWHSKCECWAATIRVAERRTSLGFYADEVAAAHAYDVAARAGFGRYATVNFPRPGERCATSA